MTQRQVDRPITVGPFTLPGRVYLPAHQPGLASNGQVTDRYVAYHRERARAGAAMQVTGATPIAPSVEWADICLWNIDESIVPGYQRLGEAVRAEGGRMIAQLAHPGPTEFEGVEVIGPSRDFSEVSRQVAVAATPDQLERIVGEYARAADRCRRGELDGVEISMAHGLLLAAFLSPLTNHRDDEFGGDLERRLTFPVQVLDAVREAIGPDLVLGVRLGADDLVPGGLEPEEAGRIAAALEDRVDYLSIMVGNNNRLEARTRHWPPTPARPGLFRDVVRTVKQHVSSVPVAAVGRILTLDLAEDLIASGDADLVGMVRAQIADPELLPLSRAGRTADVRPCIGASVCVNSLMLRKPLTCLVNPDVADSGALTAAPRLDGQSAVVVGGGPGGLEAARRLAVRGARVTLLERSLVLGGRMAQWGRAPSRREFTKWLRWQQRQLQELGVDVRLGVAADATRVTALAPDTVVLATGAPAAPVALPGDGSVEVLTPDTAFDEGAVSGRVLVHDGVGELDGALIADYLASTGAEVVLTTPRIHVGEGEGINTLVPMLRHLAEQGIPTIERVRPVRAENGEVVLDGVFGGPATRVPADVVVAWAGGDPDTSLRAELRSAGLDPLLIGDLLRPRRVADATADAKNATDALRPTPAQVP
ncbi:FAD-dependent oxidoreductase [Ornithinimicrobium cavernae]|uniref:oxidoreductase n=1 Tax=Ornithinimicrobium cavernae TaxID=2666047 RepID=UPI00137ACCF4|nr:FAD-dependent oxidoreductase [Ornithinimicrobium cavernae]